MGNGSVGAVAPHPQQVLIKNMNKIKEVKKKTKYGLGGLGFYRNIIYMENNPLRTTYSKNIIMLK